MQAAGGAAAALYDGMSKMLPVLHGAAKAISPAEFRDALRAVSPPRFPGARPARQRNVGLAVSGGVDSMALAYLCSQLHRVDPWFKVSDHEVHAFRGYIVDHQMRPGSREEAVAVRTVLKDKIGIESEIYAMRWELSGSLPPGAEPSSLPNVESVARRLRYRILGAQAFRWSCTSVLLAHHQDDQAETVFMRLLNGHGVRGLRGMRPATDIPECNGLHGVDQSGFHDEIDRQNPFFRIGISGKKRKWLKQDLAADLDPGRIMQEMQGGYDFDMYTHPFLTDEVEEPVKRWKRTLPLETMEVEDGGIYLYRPLLEFSKERLIATCVENKIPWFEDATNADPTLTMRNAVRHLFKGYELPKALRKPAILRLAKRCQAKVAAQEAEAERMMGRMVLEDQAFEANTGTLVVQLPEVKPARVPFSARHSTVRQDKRRDHNIHIATIMVQKLLSYVSPEQTLTPLSDLKSAATRLFPSLANPTEPWDPKAFTVCGVFLTPLPGPPLRWYLSRAPYDSKLPKPELRIRAVRLSRRWLHRPSKWAFSPWTRFGLYDNRWWVSLHSRVPFELAIAPLQTEYMKEFRDLLSERGRADLADILKTHAPGKVRYTLPAVYARGNIMPLVRTTANPFEVETKPLDPDELDVAPKHIVDGKLRDRKYAGGMPMLIRNDRCSRKDMAQMRDRKMRLVALPTLGIAVPGVENWIGWRLRYRNVDTEMLGGCRTREDEWRRGLLGEMRARRGTILGKRGKRMRRARGISRVRRLKTVS